VRPLPIQEAATLGSTSVEQVHFGMLEYNDFHQQCPEWDSKLADEEPTL
jgi:hypothetical protein